LHLARQRVDFLRGLELESRVSLLLNRCEKRPIIPAVEIERMIGLPVVMELPNSYKSVHDSFTGAKPVDPASDLGKRFKELARQLLSRNTASPPPKRFVDYFNISPARFSFHDSAKK
jgi:Flp pilus assembly CpaE family ATPase